MLISPDIEIVNMGVCALKETNFEQWLNRNMFNLPILVSVDGGRLITISKSGKRVRFLAYLKNPSYLIESVADIIVNISNIYKLVKQFEDENQ